MKTYLSTTKANSHRTLQAKRLRLVVFLLTGLLALFFLFPIFLKSVSVVVLTPVVYTKSWFENSPHTLAAFWRDRTDLSSQIDTLEQRLKEAGLASEKEILLEQENVSLRELFNENSPDDIFANVVARPPHTPYDSMVLDAGTDDGVQVGSLVFSGKNVAIGSVVAAFPRTSIASLFSSPGVESTTYILGPNIFANARGAGGGFLEVGVPQGIALAVGDLVVLPGLESGMVGRIASITSIPSEPQQFAYVSLPISLQGLRFVRIGSAPPPTLSFEEITAVVDEVKKSVAFIDLPPGVLIDVATTSSSTASSTVETQPTEVEINP